MDRQINRYTDRVLRTMPYNRGVADAFFHVQNMLKPPTSLLHPKVMWQVLTTQPPSKLAPSHVQVTRNVNSQAATPVSGD